MQFYFTRPIHKGDFVKGTGEDEQLIGLEGPLYSAWPADFTDKMIGKCVREGWVAFMATEV